MSDENKQSTPERIIPALRQYRDKFDGGGYVVAFDYAATVEAVRELERQLQEARGRCRFRFAYGCVKYGTCECGLRPDTSTEGEPE